MFYEGDILGIHIEPTSKCNAKCPVEYNAIS